MNADDLGLTIGVNRAILEAHERGIVTSTTLMANSRAFAGATELARGDSKLSVGCHIVLMDGEPILPADRVATLLEPHSNTVPHRFRDSLNDFVIASFRHKLNPEEIEAEAAAQIERIQSAGDSAVALRHAQARAHVSRGAAAAAARGQGARGRGGAQSVRAGVAAATG